MCLDKFRLYKPTGNFTPSIKENFDYNSGYNKFGGHNFITNRYEVNSSEYFGIQKCIISQWVKEI